MSSSAVDRPDSWFNHPLRGLVLILLLAVVWLLWRQHNAGAPPEPVRFSAVQPDLFGGPHALTVAWADVDGDGDPDEFVGFLRGASRLYRNNEGVFEDEAAQVGLATERSIRTSSWGDYDGDGDPDLFIGFAGESPVTALYRNDGVKGFVDVTDQVGLRLDSGVTRQASWIDFDGDGDLDLFLAFRDRANRMFRNDGPAGFTDVTEATGLGDARRTVGAVWFDADEDGDLDLYDANMDGDANGLWLNDGGVFHDEAAKWGLADGGRPLGVDSLGTVRPCVVDFDNDGHLDLFTANYGPNGLFQNLADGRPWANVARDLGLANDSRYDTCIWADFDNDRWEDLYVNGTVTGGVSYRDWLMRRDRHGRFLDVTPPEIEELAADHGAAWVDYDHDGDMDLSLAGAGDDGMHLLLQNLLRPEVARHALEVSVLDAQGHATRAGSEVRVYVAGRRRLLGTRLVDTGSGYNSQNVLPVHFGLPGAQPVDVEITTITGHGRVSDRIENVDPAQYSGSVLEVRVGADGKIVR